MKSKHILICLVSFTLSMFLFLWPENFYKIETNDWQETLVTKDQLFISSLKQSGELSGLYGQGRDVYIWTSKYLIFVLISMRYG